MPGYRNYCAQAEVAIMSFVKGNSRIEAWLNSSGITFTLLGNSKYVALLNNWRAEFSAYLEGRKFVYQGDKAMNAMEDLLPRDVFIFNFPGYRFLPASTNVGDAAYAYSVKNLGNIAVELMNESDSIICDLGFRCTCIYTHEWQCLATPKYYERTGC